MRYNNRAVKIKSFTDNFKGGFNTAKNLDVILLMDFYGDMLTKKQYSFLDHYYNDDLSLSEIAANEKITRQGVRDAIKRAESQLYDMEEKLGLVARFETVKNGLEEIMECADQIGDYNREHTLSREINDCTAKIKAVAQTLIME